MAGATTYLEFFSLQNSALQLYRQALRELARYPVPTVIPATVISNLFQAASEGYSPASEELVNLLIQRSTSLAVYQAMSILQNYASFNRKAAYICALAYIGKGKFCQSVDFMRSIPFFFQAIRLGHQAAFGVMLDSLCDGSLKMSDKQFLLFCRELAYTHRVIDPGITLGTLLCGLEISGRPKLNQIFKKTDYKLGYAYLRYAYQYGNKEQCEAALATLGYCYKKHLFKDDASAMKFKEELLASKHPPFKPQPSTRLF